jgi:hypothetical protein
MDQTRVKNEQATIDGCNVYGNVGHQGRRFAQPVHVALVGDQAQSSAVADHVPVIIIHVQYASVCPEIHSNGMAVGSDFIRQGIVAVSLSIVFVGARV